MMLTGIPRLKLTLKHTMLNATYVISILEDKQEQHMETEHWTKQVYILYSLRKIVDHLIFVSYFYLIYCPQVAKLCRQKWAAQCTLNDAPLNFFKIVLNYDMILFM